MYHLQQGPRKDLMYERYKTACSSVYLSIDCHSGPDIIRNSTGWYRAMPECGTEVDGLLAFSCPCLDAQPDFELATNALTGSATVINNQGELPSIMTDIRPPLWAGANRGSLSSHLTG